MKAYKLFKQRKDGSIGPLFINARQRLEPGVWYDAEDHPTKGFAHRPGWHCAAAPTTKHLSEKGRVWYAVEIEDFHTFPRPEYQGGEWLIARRMRVIEAV